MEEGKDGAGDGDGSEDGDCDGGQGEDGARDGVVGGEEKEKDGTRKGVGDRNGARNWAGAELTWECSALEESLAVGRRTEHIPNP